QDQDHPAGGRAARVLPRAAPSGAGPSTSRGGMMAPLSAAELQDFADAVDKVAGAHWPRARTAGEDPDLSALQALWTTAARQGWTELAAEESLDAVVAALSRLGRVACPLPLMDVYVAVRLLPQESAVVADIVAGTVRPVAACTRSDTPHVRFVEAA